MPVRTGPSLPQSLLDELKSSNDNPHKHKRKSGPYAQLSRKEARKQERQGKKQRKAVFFTAADNTGSRPNVKRSAAHEHPESPQHKKQKVSQPEKSSTSSQPSGSISADSTNHATSSKKTQSVDKPSTKSKAKKSSESVSGRPSAESRVEKTKKLPAVLPRTRKEEEEDAYIAYLESKLGYGKGGKKPGKHAPVEDDGLDDLLGALDQFESTMLPSARLEEPDYDDASEESEGDESLLEDEEEEEDASDEEWTGFNAESDEEAPELLQHEPPSEPKETPDATTSRYIPPHLRNRQAEPDKVEDSEAQMRLTRQLKGLLNRLSEQNISSILDGIEEIYRGHRRHDVTSTLTTLIINGISSHSILLDSYVVLHAALVSSLHKLIGVDFAAHVVQTVVASYEQHFATVQQEMSGGNPQADDDALGKECSNLIVLLSELYNFQVISCVLIYDIIRGLLDGDLTEFKVELLLKITRNSGQQLRQDDPTALKSIIEIVHNKIPGQADSLSSRTRFMLETLSNLKNNKVKRVAGQAPGGEAVERLKKFLSGLTKKRHVRTHEPLRVSLEDLHSADTKGKWWLVGAAWAGDPLAEHQDNHAVTETTKAETGENELLKLARKQGMNTDIRRSIFVVLMGSEDYVDACERLAQLKLTEVQQREIIRVILHCCGNAKSYNPYYTLVVQHFCKTSHSHRITLQFCLWDFLRDMGESNIGGAEVIKNLSEDDFGLKHISNTRLRHVAKAYGWWIAKDSCTLAILKPVDFTVLKAQTRTFLKELFIQIFISSQVSTPLLSSDPEDYPTSKNRGAIEEVFIKATKMQTLALGLIYFIGETFKDGADGVFVKWASQVALDTLRTGMDVISGL